jgi:hypothetical protein
MKKPTVSKLKKKLDAVFSQYIRLRDSNEFGYYKCITCPKIIYWKDGHCCHYRTRNKLSLRFNEENCNAGCVNCNLFDRDHLGKYAIAIMDKYGDNIIKELDLLAQKTIQIKVPEYLEKIEYYKQAVKELAEAKGISI